MRVSSLPKAVTRKRTGPRFEPATFSVASERSMPLRHTGRCRAEQLVKKIARVLYIVEH